MGMGTLSSIKMPPKGKKPAPAPFPQGKAGSTKKAAKNPLLEKRPRNFGIGQDIQQAQPVAYGEMARIRPPPTPEEDPEHAPEGSSCDRPILQHPRSKHRRRDVQAAQQVQT